MLFRSLARILCLALSLASLVALPLGAQEKSTKETKAAGNVPPSALPPAGLCRVWLENVPVSQQPAPTDCATAIKNRPNSARIVFGSLKDEAAKPPQKAGISAPGIPGRAIDARRNGGLGGVHPVISTAVPAVRPSSDSGRKRRP